MSLNLKKYAIIYGAGGVSALQALKMEIFSFPPKVDIYLGYIFSIITVFCVFLGGSSIIEMLRKINEAKKTGDADPDPPKK